MDRSPDNIDEEFILRNIHCVIIDSCIELFASLLRLDTYLENKQVSCGNIQYFANASLSKFLLPYFYVK